MNNNRVVEGTIFAIYVRLDHTLCKTVSYDVKTSLGIQNNIMDVALFPTKRALLKTL